MMGLRARGERVHACAVSAAAKTLTWNGRDLPPELAGLPPGQYTLEPIETAASIELTEEEVDGLYAAGRSVAEGRCVPWAEASERLRQRAAR
jgi:hypothetical protein